MKLVNDVLMEFRGQLSISDIYNMTYKELGYLREHRRQQLSDPDVAKAEAMQQMLGM